MIEIIKETLNELKSIKISNQNDKEKIEKSVQNLEFIVKEYKKKPEPPTRALNDPRDN